MEKPLFVPYKAVAQVTDGTPFAVNRLGNELFLTVSIGSSFQVFGTLNDFIYELFCFNVCSIKIGISSRSFERVHGLSTGSWNNHSTTSKSQTC